MEKNDLLMNDFQSESFDINVAGHKIVGAGCIPQPGGGGDVAFCVRDGKYQRDPEYDYK